MSGSTHRPAKPLSLSEEVKESNQSDFRENGYSLADRKPGFFQQQTSSPLISEIQSRILLSPIASKAGRPTSLKLERTQVVCIMHIIVFIWFYCFYSVSGDLILTLFLLLYDAPVQSTKCMHSVISSKDYRQLEKNIIYFKKGISRL
jgi:hypothetical protein